jgi:putative ABC transport system permease protein
MSWFRRLWTTLRPGRVQREIDRELSFHLAERADQLQAEGLTKDQATRRARLQLGNPVVHAQRTLEARIELKIDALIRHLRYAVRALARTPGFSATVVLTLALGIGANSAVFSAIDAVLLRALPFPDGDRLVRVGQRQEGNAENNIAPTRLEDWNRFNGTFEAITGYYSEDASETSDDFPERLRRAFVAPRFVDVWGVPPALGRGTAARRRS